MKQCGIYKITNLKNKHFYIGQSVDISKRFREHCFYGAHPESKDHNSPIHKAIYKYGKENFELKILEECSKEQLNEKEIYWIEKLQATKNGNYNILKGGQDRVKFDEKPVELYDLKGNYIKTIESAIKTAEELGISKSSVYGVLHKERPTCKGYQLKYANDSQTSIKNFVSKQGGVVQVEWLDPKTNKVIKIFNSIAEAAKSTKSDSSTISKVCRGKLKTTNGYGWRYHIDKEV